MLPANKDLIKWLMDGPDSKTMMAQVEKSKNWCAARGIRLNPLGAENAKTGCPSTYRPVEGPESTCPKTCPYMTDGKSVCYASLGNMAHIVRRATDDVAVNLNTAAVAINCAARWDMTARLHVSGDFCRRGYLDIRYIDGLTEIASVAKSHWGKDVVAWSYEHLGPELRDQFSSWYESLREEGVVVRKSDHFGPGGVVVVPFEEFYRAKRETGLPMFKCPAQCVKDHSITCQKCGLCWTREDLLVAFDGHTSLKKEIYRRTRNPYAQCVVKP